MSWPVAVGRKRAHEVRRSLWDNVFLLVAVYLIFVALYLTVGSVAGDAVDDGQWSSLAVGYVTVLLLQQTLQTFSAYVTSAAATGALELLALSRPGLARVFIAEFIVQTVLDVLRMSTALVLIVLTIRRPLDVDLPRLLLVLVPTLAGGAGIGLAMAGATLAFKRTSGLAAILSLAMLALVAAPVDRMPWLRLLPIADGAFLLRAIASGTDDAVTVGRTLGLIVGGAAYLAVGLGAFRWFEHLARDRGVMGHY